MLNESNYWKCEYENLRRKKNREISRMKACQLKFMDKTWRLLHLLGMKDEEILNYYKEN